MDSLFFWYHNFGIYYFPNRGGGVINSTCLEPFVSAETLCRVNNAWSGEKNLMVGILCGITLLLMDLS